MLDIKFIRENSALVRDAADKKNIQIDIDHLIRLDDERLRVLREIEECRATQNTVSDTITHVSVDERADLIERMREVKEKLKTLEETYSTILTEWKLAMLYVPNIPSMEAPVGPDEASNIVIKYWGKKTEFEFEPKDHVEIMNALGMVDFERGVKVHGFRGYFLKGDGVRLCFAIWMYALDFWSARGFNPIIPPMLVRRDALEGCGFVPQGEADIYKVQDGNYLVGTSEVPLMGMYMDEILTEDQLPIKMLGYSPCYRLEVGSYSKDVKGLIRVHEFQKVEQVVLCEASHEASERYHQEVQRNTEEFIESFGIPYQVIMNSTGDMGLGKVKMYDIELWVPKESTYREISSASYFHDFQTRRLNIRYRTSEGSLKFVHSLNCTAIPTPRILVSLIENCQTIDGRVHIPEALRPYMGGREYIG
jgi:seryl-tRNA synthetase